jgi:hypothetical protein
MLVIILLGVRLESTFADRFYHEQQQPQVMVVQCQLSVGAEALKR